MPEGLQGKAEEAKTEKARRLGEICDILRLDPADLRVEINFAKNKLLWLHQGNRELPEPEPRWPTERNKAKRA